MFCPDCGTQLNDGARFCTDCGKQISSSDGFSAPQSYQQPVEPISQHLPENEKKSASKKGRTAGIVLFVIGVLAFISSASNGTLTDISDIPGVVSLALKIGFVVGGVYLFYKNKDK